MIIIAYKNEGQLLGELTQIIKNKYSASRICFTGRLDPMAKGKMMYLLNDSVDEMENYMGLHKTYRFNLTVGLSTKSGDILGTINNVNFLNHKFLYPTLEKIKIAIRHFNGNQYIQKYPSYSSYKIKKNNMKKPLWYFAKNNMLDETDIPSHQVKIFSIHQSKPCRIYYNSNYFINKLEKLDENSNSFQQDTIIQQYINMNSYIPLNHFILQIPMEATVSSGTYIRQLCEDIGYYISFPCCAEAIERTQIHF